MFKYVQPSAVPMGLMKLSSKLKACQIERVQRVMLEIPTNLTQNVEC